MVTVYDPLKIETRKSLRIDLVSGFYVLFD